MASPIKRFVGRVETGFQLAFKRQLTVGFLLSLMITAACLLCIALAPSMSKSEGGWTSGTSWKKAMLEFSWIPFAAGAWLKLSEKAKRKRRERALDRRTWGSRKMLMAQAITGICDGLKNPDKINPAEMAKYREMILMAVMYAVEGRFDMGDDYYLVANVLVFRSELDTMQVEVRSRREIPAGPEHDRDLLAAWRAVKEARIYAVDDIQDDQLWRNAAGERYRSVVCVPITRNKVAYAVLTIDSKVPYAFYGKIADLTVLVEPYVRLLAASFPDGALNHACDYAPKPT